MGLAPELVQSLVRLIEMKDSVTASHTWRVVLYSRAIAEKAGVSAHMLEAITSAAAVHDVGKLDVPDEILLKPGPLTPDERAIMQTHTVKGHERLIALGVRCPVHLDLVRHHHERWNGSGYPDHLAGEEIAVAARMFGVIDTFDAMTSARPYRRAVGDDAVQRALQVLRTERGTTFWPEAVDVFVDLWNSGELNWIHEHFNDARPIPEPIYGGSAKVITGRMVHQLA